MGTNYYATIQTGDRCEHCGHGERSEELHVGKSSAGWRFLFRAYSVHPGRDALETVAQWFAFLRRSDVQLRDEAGDPVALADFFGLIEKKAELRSHVGLVANDYGDGPADFCRGEFS